MTFSTVSLTLILAAVAFAVWFKARREPDWRVLVCRGHGGDAVGKCAKCGRAFCGECAPEGHCAAAREEEWAGGR